MPPKNVLEKNNLDVKTKIDQILQGKLNLSNIFTFHEKAINDLIKILERIKSVYKDKHTNLQNLSETQIEDLAISEIGLGDEYNIINILNTISERQESLKNLENEVLGKIHQSSQILVEPDTRQVFDGMGAEKYEAKELLPRLFTLVYILENDLGISLENLEIIQGQVREEMMRQEPYFRVNLPELERVVYICNEEGNATFIFDTKELEKHNIVLPELDQMTKIQFKELKILNPKIGVRIIQNIDWRQQVLASLTEDIEEKVKSVKIENSDIGKIESVENYPGWVNAGSVSSTNGNKEVNASTNAILKEISKLKQLSEFQPNKFFFKNLKTSRGRVTEHFHSKVLEKLKEHFNIELAESYPGWVNANIISKNSGNGEVNAVYKTISIKLKELKLLKEFQPNELYFKNLKGKNYSAQYFHPKVLERLKEIFDIESVENYPGWVNAGSVSSTNGNKEVNASSKIILKEISKLKLLSEFQPNELFFKILKGKNRSTEYFHPKVLEKLKEHFNKK